MKLLAIDPSPTATGTCLIVGGDLLRPRLRLWDWTALAARQGLHPPHHCVLPLFESWLQMQIDQLGPEDEVAFEIPGVGHGRHFDLWGSGTVIAMHHAIVGRLAMLGRKPRGVMATSLKLFHCGHGHAPKRQMVRAANRCGVVGHRFVDDNLADTYLIARWALGAPAPTELEARAAA